MDISLEEIRALFPEITDEAITDRRNAAQQSKAQSLRDRISSLVEEQQRLTHELNALAEAQVPESEVNEG